MRAAIIGAGKVSTQHIKAYQACSVEIAAVMSRTKDGARRKAEECGIEVPVYDTLAELFERECFEIVSVTSPPEKHAEHILAAAEHDKHILVEKPAVLTIEEGDKVTLALLAKKHLKTRVSFVLRWNDLVQNIKIEIPRLGKIFYLECDYWHGSSHSKTHAVGKEYGTRTKQIGAFFGGGCHAVDMAQFLLGSMITQVQALTPKGEENFQRTTAALVHFENGAIGKISATDECFMPYQFNIRIFGENGTIDLNKLYTKSSDARDWVTIAGAVPDSGAVWHHPFTAMIKDFVDCIRENREASCDFFEASWTHFVCFAAEESAKQDGVPLLLGPYGN